MEYCYLTCTLRFVLNTPKIIQKVLYNLKSAYIPVPGADPGGGGNPTPLPLKLGKQ